MKLRKQLHQSQSWKRCIQVSSMDDCWQVPHRNYESGSSPLAAIPLINQQKLSKSVLQGALFSF